MPTTERLWGTRLDWTGEFYLGYDKLDFLTYTRFRVRNSDLADGPSVRDEVTGVPDWRLWYGAGGSSDTYLTGEFWEVGARLNVINPAGSQSWIGSDNPSNAAVHPPAMTSGKYLVGMWYYHNYTMTHIPLISTRGDGEKTPLFHLATVNYGSLRHQVYDGSGALILDVFEGTPPWGTTNGWQWIGQLIDFDEGTSQILSMNYASRETWASPARSLNGTPNPNPTGQIRVFGMGDAASFWAGGGVDEFFTARPTAEFTVDGFLEDLRASRQANAGNVENSTYPNHVISDTQIAASGGNATFMTSSRHVKWLEVPTFEHDATNLTSMSYLVLESDGSVTDYGQDPASLPAPFDGYLILNPTIGDGGSYRGTDVTFDDIAAPVVSPIDDITLDPEQSTTITISSQGGWEPITYGATSSDNSVATVNLSGTSLTVTAVTPGDAVIEVTATDVDGRVGSTTFLVTVNASPPVIDPIPDLTVAGGSVESIPLTATSADPFLSWSFVENDPAQVITTVISGSTLEIEGGFSPGIANVTVTVTDSLGQTDSQVIRVTVILPPIDPQEIPAYAQSPILIYGDNDEPQAVVIDAIEGVITKEVNGEETFTFVLERNHHAADLCIPETWVEVAGERYRIRRVTDERSGSEINREVYCEAPFYDLSTAGAITGREFSQVRARQVMTLAVNGTGWTVGEVTVTTLRTYEIDKTNPLALLRTVQERHGGDLIFDNKARVVHLYANSARDQGVSFFYGRGLSGAKKVVDTTSLVTRIYPETETGQTIASVNNGVPYVENFSYTDEVKEATYTYSEGTSPYTMLAMANLALASRSKPKYSYEVTVADLSWNSEQEIDRFDVGDLVTVIDTELGIQETQRIVAMEYNVVEPWNSGLTLSGKLRELGTDDDSEAGVIESGVGTPTFDLVPFNLLMNGRFDNGLNHWARQGVTVVENQQGTSDFSALFEGSGERWIEQTVAPDNRGAYALSFDIQSRGPQGWVPNVRAIAEVTYEDGSSETIELELS